MGRQKCRFVCKRNRGIREMGGLTGLWVRKGRFGAWVLLLMRMVAAQVRFIVEVAVWVGICGWYCKTYVHGSVWD